MLYEVITQIGGHMDVVIYAKSSKAADMIEAFAKEKEMQVIDSYNFV